MNKAKAKLTIDMDLIQSMKKPEIRQMLEGKISKILDEEASNIAFADIKIKSVRNMDDYA